MSDPDPTYALGVSLHLLTTAEGGRRTPLAGGSEESVRFTFRPNSGLPQMTRPEQKGAQALAFSRENVQPGEDVRLVIVPPYPLMVSEWSRVRVGDVLPVYEGSRVFGHCAILWLRETVLPLPEARRGAVSRLGPGAGRPGRTEHIVAIHACHPAGG